MAIPHSELQKLNPSARIELFVLELVEGLHYATGNPSSVPTTFRFHAGSNMNTNQEIIWQGNTYQKLPMSFEGAEFSGKGQIPRPTLTVSNVLGTITSILLTVNQTTTGNDLTGATVTRIRTLAKFLDAVNFAGGVNPYGTPDPNAEFPQEIYSIDRKASETRDAVSFELAAPIDLAGVRAPKRQCTRKDFPSIGRIII